MSSVQTVDKAEHSKKLKELFRRFDVNGDGAIDRGELTRVLEMCGVPVMDINALIDCVDRNGDGVVQYDEFIDWIMSGDDIGTDQLDNVLDGQFTTELKLPSPCDSGLEDNCVYFDVGHIIEFPTSQISVALLGIYDSFYIGVNRVRLRDARGRFLNFTVATVDGRPSSEERQLQQQGEPWQRFCAGGGHGGWWAVAGEEHELTLRLPQRVLLASIGLWCVNQGACPKVMRVTDADPANQGRSKAAWSKDRSFSLGGLPAGTSTMLHEGKATSIGDIAVRLNRGELRCARGFASFYPALPAGGPCARAELQAEVLNTGRQLVDDRMDAGVGEVGVDRMDADGGEAHTRRYGLHAQGL
uniref:EF-hand domain-containing protein n=1 Tax=Alexandrium monilatum TaxID=311494 RepID=A0A7S4W203_9DINO